MMCTVYSLVTVLIPKLWFTIQTDANRKVTVPFDVEYRDFSHTGEADACTVGGSHLSCYISIRQNMPTIV